MMSSQLLSTVGSASSIGITPPPRKFVLIALPLLAFLLSLAPAAQAQVARTVIAASDALTPTSIGLVFVLRGGSDFSSFEARLGSDGQWQDVGSQVWGRENVYFYTFTGLQPSTEYTVYFRATHNGSPGDTASATATTLAAANAFDIHLSGSCGTARLSFSGLNSPGNASNKFYLNLIVFQGIDGHTRLRSIAAYSGAQVANTTTVINVPGIKADELLYVNYFLNNADDSVTLSQRYDRIWGGDIQGNCPPPPSSSSGGGGDYVPKPTATPIRDSLNFLPPGIHIYNWVDGAQGKRVDARGVGNQAVIDQGLLDAVDLWGYVTPGIEVCFEQVGRTVLLDAASSPRQVLDLPAYSRAGMTCANIDRAGTVALLQSDIAPPPLVESVSHPASQVLLGCEVKPWDLLNYRESPPDGAIIGVTSTRDWLPASEKLHGYFKVRLWDTEGWISGDYVYTRGDCGD